MMQTIIDFVNDADNVYRTQNYIVKQKINIFKNSSKSSKIVSQDTYYLRTPKRDLEYERIFRCRGEQINGIRLVTSMYFRRYID